MLNPMMMPSPTSGVLVAERIINAHIEKYKTEQLNILHAGMLQS